MKTRTAICIVVVVLIVFVIIGIVLPAIGMFPSRLYCETQEINIKTGQARYRTFKAGLMTSERVEDTALSRAIGEPVNIAPIDEWHMVNLFSPPSHRISPHYIFHSALNQAQQLESLFRQIDSDKPRQREIATNVLRLWQEAGQDTGPRDYIYNVIEEEFSNNRVEATGVPPSPHP